MFSKKSLHISLAFILLIALATLGLAYGAWTDQLNINGNVTTGSLDVDFIGSDGSITSPSEIDPYNLVDCYLDYEDDLITVTITGAYPGYQCFPMITVENTGSVPADVTFNFPGSEPVPGVAIGGATMGIVTLIPGASIGQTLNIDVYDNPTMNHTVIFTFPIPVAQAAP